MKRFFILCCAVSCLALVSCGNHEHNDDHSHGDGHDHHAHHDHDHVHAQEVVKSEDYIAIEGVIQNYFDGWLTGDTTLVGSAMHSSCNLKFARDGEIRRMDRTSYLSNFKPRERLANAEGRIISIDITRTAGAAKVELETEKRFFTDYFNLLKEGDRWYITDKVSTSISKE